MNRRRVAALQSIESRVLLHGGFADVQFGGGSGALLISEIVADTNTRLIQVLPDTFAGDGSFFTVHERSTVVRRETVGMIRRYSAAGLRDASFAGSGTLVVDRFASDPNWNTYVRTMFRDAQGGILVLSHGGSFSQRNSASVARYTASGAPASADPFTTLVGFGEFYDVEQASDGSIYTIGRGVDVESSTAFSMVGRLRADGTPDPAFAANGILRLSDVGLNPPTIAQAVVPRPGGGAFVVADGTVVALTPAGVPDPTFSDDGRLTIQGAVVDTATSDAQGRLLLIEDAATASGGTSLNVARYAADGARSLVNTGGPLVTGSAFSMPQRYARILTSPGGQTYLIGATAPYPGSSYGTAASVVRLDADGRRDDSFGIFGTHAFHQPSDPYPATVTYGVAGYVDPAGRLMLGYDYIVPGDGAWDRTRSGVRRIIAESAIDPRPQGPAVAPNEGADYAVSVDPLIPDSRTVASVAWDADASLGIAYSDVTGNPATIRAGTTLTSRPAVRMALSDGTLIEKGLVVPTTNLPPVASPRGPFDVLRGAQKYYDLGVSDPADPFLDVTVDWDDGTISSYSSYPVRAASADHWFGQSGRFEVNVTARDDVDSVSNGFVVNVFDAVIDVYRDADADGRFSGRVDPRLAGVTLTIDGNRNGAIDAGEPQFVTGASQLLFGQGLADGVVQVIVTPPSGYRVAGGAVRTATLAAGRSVSFGNVLITETSVAKVSAFFDLSGDGVQQPGEPAAPGAFFVDYDRDGRRDFDEPPFDVPTVAGSFVPAEVILPRQGDHSIVFVPGLYDGRWTVPPRFGGSRTVTVTAGSEVALAPFALAHRPAIASIERFVDANGDGVRQPGEQPLNGVVVHEDRVNPGVLDADEEVVTTPQLSIYGYLPTGDVTFRAIQPAGYTPTTPLTRTVNLAAGQTGVVQFGFNPGVITNPVVQEVAFDAHARPPELRIRFSEAVQIDTTSYLIRDPIGNPVSSNGPRGPERFDAQTNTFVIPLPTLVRDGTYTVDLIAGRYRNNFGNAGAAFSATFRFLRADADLDGRVDFDDLLALAAHYGQSQRSPAEGNFDYDPHGVVNFDDLLALALRYNATIPASDIAPTTVPAPVLNPIDRDDKPDAGRPDVLA